MKRLYSLLLAVKVLMAVQTRLSLIKYLFYQPADYCAQVFSDNFVSHHWTNYRGFLLFLSRNFKIVSSSTTSVSYNCRLVFFLLLQPFKPSRCIKASFYIPEIFSLQLRVLERKFSLNWPTYTWRFSSIFEPHPIIFIHYKLRIATAIRDL